MIEISEFDQQLLTSIQLTIVAHGCHANSPKHAVRRWDQITPYSVHPIWCAMTLLTETSLSMDLRRTGYQALLWHDVLEDTTDQLPQATSPIVGRLVQEMTFSSFDEEVKAIWHRSDEAKLLKLYDKISNLLDGTWMDPRTWNTYVAHTLKLRDFALATYGGLNITRIAHAVAVPRPDRSPEV